MPQSTFAVCVRQFPCESFSGNQRIAHDISAFDRFDRRSIVGPANEAFHLRATSSLARLCPDHVWRRVAAVARAEFYSTQTHIPTALGPIGVSSSTARHGRFALGAFSRPTLSVRDRKFSLRNKNG